ncbi:YcnI family copper-binding membrane protein [Arthrobacter sp. H14]|uniref:YcnI family copper-binding membrane protein n=1 Tax=Arthrobacter sp. H14 TaxID=1312959 RepID=UPI00047C5112|nr:YcnI family protein [Arthrobacter sp. H14]
MKKTTTSRTRRTAALIAATASLMVFGLGAASAHVGVTPDSTTEGGYSQLTFSVPNESETAGTNKVEVELPTKTPFTSVRAKPVAGWTVEVVTSELPEPVEVQGATVTEAPTSVVWTADEGNEISQEQYQTFSISVGTLPGAGTTVMLPTTQHYTDGSVRNWDEPATEGEEPESPAPSFTTTAEDASGEQDQTETSSATAETEAAPASTVNTTGQTLGWIALVAGVLGLAAGLIALTRTRTHKS